MMCLTQCSTVQNGASAVEKKLAEMHAASDAEVINTITCYKILILRHNGVAHANFSVEAVVTYRNGLYRHSLHVEPISKLSRRQSLYMVMAYIVTAYTVQAIPWR